MNYAFTRMNSVITPELCFSKEFFVSPITEIT